MLCIKNGNIHTMTGYDYLRGYILIDKGKIVELGSNFSHKIERTSDEIIDAHNQFVFPGFIDSHSHIGLIEDSLGIEGNDCNEKVEPVTPHLRAVDGINTKDPSFRDAVEAGITSVVISPGSTNVIGGQSVALKTAGKTIDDMILRQPSALKIAFGENPKRIYGLKGATPTTRMGIAALIRDTLRNAANKKNIEKMDLKQEVLQKVLDKKIPLTAHVHRADDILTAIRIAEEFNVDLTLIHATEGYLVADILMKKDIPVIVGPLLSFRDKVELKNQSLINPAILSKKNIIIALTTDHPVIPIQYLPISAALAVREGMTEDDALKSITINAAIISGIASKVGTLEAGKDADVVIFNKHPLDIQAKVMKTLIDGKVVFSREREDKIINE